jgi:tetratricopeptide (TPR) repeat protein
MGLFDTLFGKKKITLDDADKINDEFIKNSPVAINDENEMMRNASKLMSSKKHSESIDLYTKLSESYPKNKGLYESQIGANYYFLGDYEKAIEYYVSAMNNGSNKNMMDDNIWEAAEAFSKLQTPAKDGSIINTKSLIEKYIEIFPNGSYVKKAKNILGK